MDEIAPVPELNLQEWIARFPLEHSCFESNGILVSDPQSVAYFEQTRSRLQETYDFGPPHPTDVFVLGLGKGPRRDLTKVGGTPYRPADKPWPMTPDGRDMTFLTQFRFTESRDLIGDIPDDIMLVFCINRELSFCNIEGKYLIEWYPLGLTDLIETEDVPQPAWTFVNCYGVRHRTNDYERCLPASVLGRDYFGYPLASTSASWTRVWGMKIGGLPLPNVEATPEDDAPPGRFLCSLANIHPVWDIPYPWINVPEPHSLQKSMDHRLNFALADCFVMNFWLRPDGSVECRVEIR